MPEKNIEHDLPIFNEIALAEVPAELDRLLADNRAAIAALIQSPSERRTWKNLMLPLEEIDDRLHRFWSPITHLNAVVNSKALRKIYHDCLPKLADYHTALSHDEALYKAIKSIAEHIDFQQLNPAQRKVIDNELRDFELAGVALSPEDKERFALLTKKLSQLATHFEDNVLDATQAWFKHVTDEAQLAGIPSHAVTAARHEAEKRNLSGWVFTLEIPTYLAVMLHADAQDLREEMYTAYVTRASDQGPTAGQFDNSDTMHKILTARLALAKLLGFKNYAEYSLATKMVKSPEEAIAFLTELKEAALPKAREEFAELKAFAKETLGLADLSAWDIPFAAEKLRQSRFAISQEDLRPYFKSDNVVAGLFAIVKRLFQIEIERVDAADKWHEDAACYQIRDHAGQARGYVYLDLFARANKRGGAWMDDHRSRRQLNNGKLQLPIAFITCNLSPPAGDRPALFSHDDVVTLFHEFGHALQHVLTQINYVPVAGINGVPWDAVELASQFLENWAWEKESLDLMARHFETGEPLPDALFERMQKARNFQSAMQTMRQLEFALFDMRLHSEFHPEKDNQIQAILDDVRQAVSVVPTPAFNRFQHGFSHIFAGGYAAGYYSYKWAEVMAADAFSLFKEKGIFNQAVAKQFLTYILEPGGSEDPAELFKAFRGRAPRVDALLEQQGIKG